MLEALSAPPHPPSAGIARSLLLPLLQSDIAASLKKEMRSGTKRKDREKACSAYKLLSCKSMNQNVDKLSTLSFKQPICVTITDSAPFDWLN